MIGPRPQDTFTASPLIIPDRVGDEFGVLTTTIHIEETGTIGDLDVTIDYFNIEIEDTIQGIGQDTIIATCIDTGNPEFCDLINRDANGSLWLTSNGFVRDLTTNIGSVETSGVDFGMSYSMDISEEIGSLGFNVVGTWLDELITDNGVSEP